MQNFWKIETVPEAQDEFYTLSVETRTHIREKLRREVNKERPCGEHLSSCPGWYSMHVGKHLVVYAPHHDSQQVHILLVTVVGFHDDVYRKLARRYSRYGG